MVQSNMNNTFQNSINNSVAAFAQVGHVVICTIISVELPLILVAIYAVYSLVRKDNIAPIYVINLLISDLVMLCLAIISVTGLYKFKRYYAFHCIRMVSVGFMLCIAFERYLAIVWPLWYRTRHTLKVSFGVSAVVWVISLVFLLLCYTWSLFRVITRIINGIVLLFPLPLLIFFLVGTIKALSTTISVRAEERRRIVGLLVLVLLIYTLLFLPATIFFLVKDSRSVGFFFVVLTFFQLSPFADVFLYIFLRKGALRQVLACFCGCRKNRNSQQMISSTNDGNTGSSM